MERTAAAHGAQEITMRVRIETEGKGLEAETIFKTEDGGALAVLWQYPKFGWIYTAIGKYPSRETVSSYQHGIECASESIVNYYKQYGINVEFIKE